ncbi:MAG: phosphate acyltransferase PlsX [Candidatus Marinimicrobia bacterium]|nr:phosphate acyltransferase PlsX [Candidatus Neomarinimicrobiota bacterium]MCF7830104.1 phosphate acyltransferase PlsX [Candidatus Neomarinimicrobiota bacterium]MCF7882151.1 phosphate acyltransferase PlsX [Candidatus Neomarinimicrobiota bacterium]
MRIVVDAMGGDHAPASTISGALLALDDAQYSDTEIILVGPETVLRSELNGQQGTSTHIHIQHADQVVSMKESPTKAVKHKPDSSIAVGINLLKTNEADAFVSAGNTGAVMTSSLLSLGRIEGVNRPTIGSFFPTARGGCVIFDVGANPEAKPINLLQFGIMGSIYARNIFDIDSPKVALLNIGEERTKGTDVLIDAYGMLEQELDNFIGNIEGRDILAGKVDVVVCDGFVGNILLKFGESIFDSLTDMVQKEINNKPLAKIGAFLMKPVVKSIASEFSYEEHGGVPLLGINGVSIISHGSSTPKAMKNAIGVAHTMVKKRINRMIKTELEAHRVASPSMPQVDDPLIPQG